MVSEMDGLGELFSSVGLVISMSSISTGVNRIARGQRVVLHTPKCSKSYNWDRQASMQVRYHTIYILDKSNRIDQTSQPFKTTSANIFRTRRIPNQTGSNVIAMWSGHISCNSSTASSFQSPPVVCPDQFSSIHKGSSIT